jgi:hypothetical protein
MEAQEFQVASLGSSRSIVVTLPIAIKLKADSDQLSRKRQDLATKEFQADDNNFKQASNDLDRATKEIKGTQNVDRIFAIISQISATADELIKIGGPEETSRVNDSPREGQLATRPLSPLASLDDAISLLCEQLTSGVPVFASSEYQGLKDDRDQLSQKQQNLARRTFRADGPTFQQALSHLQNATKELNHEIKGSQDLNKIFATVAQISAIADELIEAAGPQQISHLSASPPEGQLNTRPVSPLASLDACIAAIGDQLTTGTPPYGSPEYQKLKNDRDQLCRKQYDLAVKPFRTDDSTFKQTSNDLERVTKELKDEINGTKNFDKIFATTFQISAIADKLIDIAGPEEKSRLTAGPQEEQFVRRQVSTSHEEFERWRDVVAASGVDLSKALAEIRREDRQLEMERDQRLLG